MLSRRELLKTAGLCAASLALPGNWRTLPNTPAGQPQHFALGRVTTSGHPARLAPDAESEKLAALGMDELVEIKEIALDADETMPNRIWYKLADGSFTHSSRVQIVKNELNQSNEEVPKDGRLGEITVPICEAYRNIGDASPHYRFYYQATFWVMARLYDQQGNTWYQVLDDKYYVYYYVHAENVRLVPFAELQPISPEVDPDKKRLLVDLRTQTVIAYEDDVAVFFTKVSTGIKMSEGGFATPAGIFRILRKRPCRHMASGPSIYGSGFDLPGVPWVSYFTAEGVAFHGTYWHNNFGLPQSHGCINMPSDAARWVYLWTTPWVPEDNYYLGSKAGTRVDVIKL